MDTLDEFSSHLTSISPEKWRQLFRLIPAMEGPEAPGKWKEMKKQEDGTFNFPHIEHSNVEMDFLRVIYDLGLVVDFDWMSWSERAELMSVKQRKFESYEMETLCKLLTAIVRGDRFCEGELSSRMQDGTISGILNAMKKHVLNAPAP